MNENNFTGFNLSDNGWDILAAFVDEALPHGNGINYDWSGKKTVNYVYFSNGYQVMNEAGFYIGVQWFTVRMDRRLFHDALFNLGYRDHKAALYNELIKSFDVQFNGNRHLGEYHRLREYLVDTIACSLADYFKRHLDANKRMILFA